MENRSSKKGYIITIIILLLIVIALAGFIAFSVMKHIEQEEKKATMLNGINIDLNAFYQVSETLERFDKAFNNPKSLYLGYIYTSKRLEAPKFDLGAAIYASMILDMAGTNLEVQFLPEPLVKSNFEKIFGNNLKYTPSEVNSGEIYKVAYDNKYYYIAPSEVDPYAEKYLAFDYKTSLEEDKIIVNRRIVYVVYEKDVNGTLTAINLYKDHLKQSKIGTIAVRNGSIKDNEILSRYGSKMKKYNYTFIQNKGADYNFYSIEAEQ